MECRGQTERRKIEHIVIAVKENVEAPSKTTLLDDVELVHMPLTSISLEEVELETSFLGKRVKAPIFVSGMTGGTPLAAEINRAIGEAVEELGLAMGVGSQRAALEDPSLSYTFRVAREAAPTAPIVANIGASQLVSGLSERDVEKLVEMIDADAIALHLNPLQEAVQPEGEADYRGLVDRIRWLVEVSPVPVIVKETGAGFSREAAELLADTGIKAIDVGGAGGTSFSIIESIRAERMGFDDKAVTARVYGDWGVPTAASILEVRNALPGIFVIATGGLRSGLDAAKAIRLGADMAGYALPVIRAAYSGGAGAVKRLLRRFIEELRIALFLTGSRDLASFRSAPIVVYGRLKEWIESRGLKI